MINGRTSYLIETLTILALCSDHSVACGAPRLNGRGPYSVSGDTSPKRVLLSQGFGRYLLCVPHSLATVVFCVGGCCGQKSTDPALTRIDLNIVSRHQMAPLHMLRRNTLDVALSVLCVICIIIMLKTSTDPFPTWAKDSWILLVLSPFPTGNQIAFDISVGVLVSLFVYILVVRIPEWKKRQRLKANLRWQYSNLKEECITNFLFACNGSASLDLVEQLKDQEAFRRYFKEKITPDQERWHAVLNGMDDQKVAAIVQELSIFRREVEFTLTAIDVDNPQVFAFLRDLTKDLHRTGDWSSGYDEIKPMSQIMWSMHTGWDGVHGYTGKDAIADMIEAI